VETDEGAAEMEERLMDVGPALVADREPTVLGQPSQRPLDDPAMPSQALAALDALARNAHLDVAPPQGPATARNVVRLVRVQLVRAFAGPSTGALDGGNAVQQGLKDGGLVLVGLREHHRERDAAAVDHKGALRARLAAIRRMRAGRRAPFFAGMRALSMLARLQSIWSASPKRLRRTCCRRAHTPACCQSRKRRQQVTPLPQPISSGSISHGMPLLSTKMIPVKAARSGTRGRPPLGLGGSGGKSGAIVSHSVSLTNGLLIRPGQAARAVPGF